MAVVAEVRQIPRGPAALMEKDHPGHGLGRVEVRREIHLHLATALVERLIENEDLPFWHRRPFCQERDGRDEGCDQGEGKQGRSGVHGSRFYSDDGLLRIAMELTAASRVDAGDPLTPLSSLHEKPCACLPGHTGFEA